jgi:anti-sigma-K factor RskA
MTPHDEMLDNIAMYALGSLSPGEAAEVAAHIETCKECRAEYQFMRPAVTAVAYSAEACADASTGAAAPSPLIKARVMQRVRAEAGQQRVPHVWPAYLFAAACLAIALITGLAQIALNARLISQAQTIADLTAPDARRFAFSGGEVLTRGDHLYLAMRDLPAPPPGHVYQAWTLAKGAKTVAPSTTFLPGSGGATVVRLPETATTLAAVAVSVEPTGGSKQPTTKPIALVRI